MAPKKNKVVPGDSAEEPPKKKKQTQAEKEALQKEQEVAKKDKEAKAEKKQDLLDMANFGTQGLAAPEGSALKAAHEAYKSMPLRDPLKKQIIAQWKADKTCSWINSFLEQHITQKKTTTPTTANGWTTKFIIADQVKIPVESDAFEEFLSNLPTEDLIKCKPESSCAESLCPLTVYQNSHPSYNIFLCIRTLTNGMIRTSWRKPTR